MLQGHGDNGYQYGQEIVADFSSNVWYGKEPEGLKEHLFLHWDRINRYPAVSAEQLGARIAAAHGLPPENVLVTAGTTESIYLIAQLFKCNEATSIIIPSFAEYEDACRMHEHHIQYIDWDDLPKPGPDASLIWIANPNNPTGAVFPGIAAWMAERPKTHFVVDEAFIEFTAAVTSQISMIQRLPNMILLRSMTKAFAIPGLRLGYVVGHATLIARLRALKMPWTVNALAIEAGLYIFDSSRAGKDLFPVMSLLSDTARLSVQIGSLGYAVHPSHTHFLLCQTPWGTAKELQSYLLEKQGILIRNADNFRGLGPEFFRVACLPADKNQLLIDGLSKFREICS